MKRAKVEDHNDANHADPSDAVGMSCREARGQGIEEENADEQVHAGENPFLQLGLWWMKFWIEKRGGIHSRPGEEVTEAPPEWCGLIGTPSPGEPFAGEENRRRQCPHVHPSRTMARYKGNGREWQQQDRKSSPQRIKTFRRIE